MEFSNDDIDKFRNALIPIIKREFKEDKPFDSDEWPYSLQELLDKDEPLEWEDVYQLVELTFKK